MASDEKKSEPTIIYRAWITRNGKRIYASQYGKKAFAIKIKPSQDDKPKSGD